MRDDQEAPEGRRSIAHVAGQQSEYSGAPPPAGCPGRIAERVIAAYRRGGAACWVVLTEGETLH